MEDFWARLFNTESKIANIFEAKSELESSNTILRVKLKTANELLGKILRSPITKPASSEDVVSAVLEADSAKSSAESWYNLL